MRKEPPKEALDLKILRYRRIPSTNTAAYKLAERGSPEWTVAVSEVQTRGRGASGRKWESPIGGLWCSIILRPAMPASGISTLQFLAANATRQAVEATTGLKAGLKWPNDLVLETGKLGGILVEAKTLGDMVSFVIVGIGLNVNQRRERLPSGATSLRVVSGSEYNLRELLGSILEEIRSRYEDLNEPERIMREWWHNCVHRQRRVQVELPRGTITGITKALDLQGNLLLETINDKVERVSQGSLRVLDD